MTEVRNEYEGGRVTWRQPIKINNNVWEEIMTPTLRYGETSKGYKFIIMLFSALYQVVQVLSTLNLLCMYVLCMYVLCMYTCVYVCVYVCMYVCMYVHTHTHTHIHTRVSQYLHVCNW